MNAKTINLTSPVTITLSPDEVQIIVTGLKEVPYKFAQPVIDHIFETCQGSIAEAGKES